MSISTLNKKTKTLYNSMSVNKQSFSLNGGTRNQGYIGQTSLSRSLPRTLMKNNDLRGHGGCCGLFLKTPIVQSSLTYQNDSNVIKTSSMNNNGLLSTKYKWIRRGFPYTTIKSDQNKLISHNDLIIQKKINMVRCIELAKKKTVYTNNTYNSGLPNSQKPRTICISFENVKQKYILQSEYTEHNLYNNCIKFVKPSNNLQNTPFACNMLH
jgi:hypothetical protein